MARMKPPQKPSQALQLLQELQAEGEMISSLQSIDLEWIEPNPENVAAQEDTEEEIISLAENIRLNGLIHPLVVNEIDKQHYLLLSGERRYRAIKEHLIPGSLHGEWNMVNCVVYHNLMPQMVEIVTVSANMATREYTAAKKLELYARLTKSLQELKDMGKFTGAVGGAVAQQMGVSKQRVYEMKLIVEHMAPEQIKEVTSIKQAAAKVREQREAEVSIACTEAEPFTPELEQKIEPVMVLVKPENLFLDELAETCNHTIEMLCSWPIMVSEKEYNTLRHKQQQATKILDSIHEIIANEVIKKK